MLALFFRFSCYKELYALINFKVNINWLVGWLFWSESSQQATCRSCYFRNPKPTDNSIPSETSLSHVESKLRFGKTAK